MLRAGRAGKLLLKFFWGGGAACTRSELIGIKWRSFKWPWMERRDKNEDSSNHILRKKNIYICHSVFVDLQGCCHFVSPGFVL